MAANRDALIARVKRAAEHVFYAAKRSLATDPIDPATTETRVLIKVYPVGGRSIFEPDHPDTSPRVERAVVLIPVAERFVGLPLDGLPGRYVYRIFRSPIEAGR